MKKFLLALILCIVGFSAHAATENVICLVNGKTVIYEDVSVFHLSGGGVRIFKRGHYDIKIHGLYTCMEVDRADSDVNWKPEWENVKKMMERSIE